MAIIPSCFEYLTKFASGKWYETYTMLDKKTHDYIHKVKADMTLLRVEAGKRRAFYWIYNPNDAVQFNIHVGLTLKWEAHEIITKPYCRLFFDIDLSLDEFDKIDLAETYGYDISESNEAEVVDAIGKSIANVYKQALLISLEENGNDLDSEPLVGFDWIYTMRNRATEKHGLKISIHIITNLMLDLALCSAIVKHIKSDVILNNMELLQTTEVIARKLIEAIDETQYRLRGSLGLPFGTKKVASRDYVNLIHKDYSIPNQKYFITMKDPFNISNISVSGYDIEDNGRFSYSSACPEFVKEALKHVANIPDYNSRVWDIQTSVLKGCTMYVKRYAPSMCSICQRTHDNDNTLFLIFDSSRGVASWKCSRNSEVAPIKFYEKPTDEQLDDIELFANKRSQVYSKRIVEQTSFQISQVELNDLEEFTKKRADVKISTSPDEFEPFDQRQYMYDLNRNAAKPRRKHIQFTKRQIPDVEIGSQNANTIHDNSRNSDGEESEGYTDEEKSEKCFKFDIEML